MWTELTCWVIRFHVTFTTLGSAVVASFGKALALVEAAPACNLESVILLRLPELLESTVKFTAPDVWYLRYDIGTSSANYSKGTGIADTRLNGSGNYQTRFVNADDYRAQEFPDGSPTTINTYYLRLIKA